jgi:hypothetical protein
MTICLLDPAQCIAAQPHAGIAVLTLAAAVIQPVGAILSGQGGNQPEFRRGFQYLFSDTDENVWYRFWKCIRCGLFHEGFVKPGIILTQLQKAYSFDQNQNCLYVDPIEFLNVLRRGFNKFSDDVPANRELEKNLAKLYGLDNSQAVDSCAAHSTLSTPRSDQEPVGTCTMSPANISSFIVTETGYKILR